MKKLITTALPYANSEPHIGNFLALIAGDTYKRFLRLQGEEVSLLCGTDDNSKKILTAARLKGVPISNFLEGLQDSFLSSCYFLGIDYDYFVKTSSEDHKQNVLDVFKILKEKNLIYFGTWEGYLNPYTGEKSSKFHLDYVKVSEECVYFKWHHLFGEVEKYLKSINAEKFIPQAKDWMSWDVCISSKTDYGISIPLRPELKFYVWFDALIAYIKPGTIIDTQFFGKDITKFHTVMLIAILHVLNLPYPENLVVNHHITLGSTKISKSYGNSNFWKLTEFVNYFKSIEGLNSNVVFDIFRLTALNSFNVDSDTPINSSRYVDFYNAVWVNNFGNLYQRVLGLTKKKEIKEVSTNLGVDLEVYNDVQNSVRLYKNFHSKFLYQEAILEINSLAVKANKFFQKNEGWSLDGKELQEFLINMCYYLRTLQGMMEPLSPQTSKRISSLLNFDTWQTWENFGSVKSLPKTVIFSDSPFILFPRIK